MAEERPPEDPIGGPFVIVAAFCERVLQEKDDVHSLIRIVDRYFIEPPAKPIPLPPDVKPGFQTILYINLKAGDFKGVATVSVRVRRPSGLYSERVVSIPTTFVGDEAGNVLQIQMGFSAEETGLYWADVEVDGRLLTRVPLRVELRSSTATEPAQPSVPSDAP